MHHAAAYSYYSDTQSGRSPSLPASLAQHTHSTASTTSATSTSRTPSSDSINEPRASLASSLAYRSHIVHSIHSTESLYEKPLLANVAAESPVTQSSTKEKAKKVKRAVDKAIWTIAGCDYHGNPFWKEDEKKVKRIVVR